MCNVTEVFLTTGESCDSLPVNIVVTAFPPPVKIATVSPPLTNHNYGESCDSLPTPSEHCGDSLSSPGKYCDSVAPPPRTTTTTVNRATAFPPPVNIVVTAFPLPVKIATVSPPPTHYHNYGESCDSLPTPSEHCGDSLSSPGKYCDSALASTTVNLVTAFPPQWTLCVTAFPLPVNTATATPLPTLVNLVIAFLPLVILLTDNSRSKYVEKRKISYFV